MTTRRWIFGTLALLLALCTSASGYRFFAERLASKPAVEPNQVTTPRTVVGTYVPSAEIDATAAKPVLDEPWGLAKPNAATSDLNDEPAISEPWWGRYDDLERRLNADGIDALIASLARVDASPGQIALTKSLDLSSHVLRDDPSQLWFQLFARTRLVNTPKLDRMLGQSRGETRIAPRFVALDQSGGALARILRAPGYSIRGLAISPDGQVVAGGHGNEFILWDLPTGRMMKRVQAHRSDVIYSLAFSPDGKTLATGSGDESVRIWDAESGEMLRHFGGHPQDVHGISFSADGQRLASCSHRQWNLAANDDAMVVVWDVETGERLQSFSGHKHNVTAVSLSPDGRLVASVSQDKTIQIGDVETGTIRTLPAQAMELGSVRFSPNGERLAVASYANSEIQIWDLSTGERTGDLPGDGTGTMCLEFSPNGAYLGAGSMNGRVTIWDFAARTKCREFDGRSGPITAVVFAPDNRTVVSAGGDRGVRVWDLSNPPAFSPDRWHGGNIHSVTFAPDGSKLATSGSDGLVRIWDTENGVGIRAIDCGCNSNWVVAYSPTGEQLAVAGNDGTVRAFDSASGAVVWELTQPTDTRALFNSQAIRSLAYSPDGRQIAAGRYKVIQLWDATTGEFIRTLVGHDNIVHCVAFAPTGDALVSTSSDKTIRFWDTATGEMTRVIDTPARYVKQVAPLPNGTMLAAGGVSKTLDLVDIATGDSVQSFHTFSTYVNSVAFLHDGRTMVSAGIDETMRLWDVTTGDLLGSYSLDEPIRALATHESGKIAAGGAAGRIHVFDWIADREE